MSTQNLRNEKMRKLLIALTMRKQRPINNIMTILKCQINEMLCNIDRLCDSLRSLSIHLCFTMRHATMIMRHMEISMLISDPQGGELRMGGRGRVRSPHRDFNHIFRSKGDLTSQAFTIPGLAHFFLMLVRIGIERQKLGNLFAKNFRLAFRRV